MEERWGNLEDGLQFPQWKGKSRTTWQGHFTLSRTISSPISNLDFEVVVPLERNLGRGCRGGSGGFCKGPAPWSGCEREQLVPWGG